MFRHRLRRVDGIQTLPQGPLQFLREQEEIRVGRLPDPASGIEECCLDGWVDSWLLGSPDAKIGCVVDSVAKVMLNNT